MAALNRLKNEGKGNGVCLFTIRYQQKDLIIGKN
jgi:hypothetical protein